MNPSELIDSDRYPIHRPQTPEYARLVSSARQSFEDDAAATLPGFVHAHGLGLLRAEAEPLVENSFFFRNEHNVYLDKRVEQARQARATEAMPAARRLTTNVGSIAGDYFAGEGALQSLYRWPALAAFVAEVVGVRELHVSDDPLGAVSVNVFGPGDGHDWHFDESRFTVTLMLEAAESGGHFEYVQGLRPEVDDGDEAAITSYLDGAVAELTRLPFEPGTLSIFAGRHTMHRVTEVGGTKQRLVPVLTYSEKPGYRNSDAVRKMFWGRIG